MNNKSLFSYIIIISLFILLIPGILEAEAPYRNYTYNFWGEPVQGPQAYLPEEVWNGFDLGVGEFDSPEEVFVNQDEIFVLDTGNNRIVCLNNKFETIKIIDEFKNIENNQYEEFDNPSGIFVNEDMIFIADTGNYRIIKLNRNTNSGEILDLQAEIGDFFEEDYIFSPESILVDTAERIYVIGKNEYRGLMQFDMGGNFMGFVGAPQVSPDPVDLIWRQIATDAQRQRMQLYLPIEYNQFDIDKEGFILAVSAADSNENRVRRLSPAGEDELQNDAFHPVIGDLVNVPWGYSYTGDSQLVDIVGRSNGRYSILDGNRGRIFTYDRLGNLLYTFGGPGTQKGVFNNPVSIDQIDERIIVLDQSREEITVFNPTEYAETVHAAIDNYHEGFYQLSTEKWEEVLKRNLNYELAYIGIGRAYRREGESEKALTYFKLGNDRTNYSGAFTDYRREVIVDNFNKIVYAMLFLLIMLIISLKLKNKYEKSSSLKKFSLKITSCKIASQDSVLIIFKKILASLRYANYVLFHPFGGFWDLKHDNKGNMPASIIILVVVSATYIFIRFNTGFIFNPWKLSEVNMWVEVISIIIPFILWCSVNWALTTLMDGKGTFKDIFIATAFALTPLIIINIPITIISNFLTQQEGSFYYFFMSLGTIWALALVFLGTLTIHDYTLLKTVVTTIFIIIGMGLVFFLILLFVDQIEMIIGFINTIYREIFFRL